MTFWTYFRFKIVLKSHSIFLSVFYWLFHGFWEARGGPGLPKTLPKTMQKKHQKKHEKKGLRVMQVMQAFSPGRGGVPIRSLRAGRDCRSLRAQAPGNGSYRQCSKKPDKTLWTRTRASGARWRIYMYVSVRTCIYCSYMYPNVYTFMYTGPSGTGVELGLGDSPYENLSCASGAAARI